MFSTTRNNHHADIVKYIETELTAWTPTESLLQNTLYNHVNAAWYRILYEAYKKYNHANANRSEIEPWIQTHFAPMKDHWLNQKMQQLQQQRWVVIETMEEVHSAAIDEDDDIGLDLDEAYPSIPCTPINRLHHTMNAGKARYQDNDLTNQSTFSLENT